MKKYERPNICIEDVEVAEFLAMSEVYIMPGANDLDSPDFGNTKQSSVWDDEEL